MFKKLAATALAATAALAAPAAMAGEIETLKGGYRFLDQEHQVLVDAITRAGVTVRVNVGADCEGGHDGVYMPQDGILAICQDNAPQVHWNEVRWTANDLDTLRHEAVHLLQDCNADDGIGGYSQLWFSTDEKRVAFVKDSLSPRKIKWIIKTYVEAGASDFVLDAEMEAFSIAATINPESIAQAINSTCPAR